MHNPLEFQPDFLNYRTAWSYEHWWESVYNRDFYPCRHARALLQGLDPEFWSAMKSKARQRDFAQVDFVNIYVSSQQEAQYRDWLKTADTQLVSLLADVIADQHKVGISFDGANACYIASATCKDETSPNYNVCITARSDDWTDALLLLVFKIQHIAGKIPWRDCSRPTTWG